jgi:hypothetical protein
MYRSQHEKGAFHMEVRMDEARVHPSLTNVRIVLGYARTVQTNHDAAFGIDELGLVVEPDVIEHCPIAGVAGFGFVQALLGGIDPNVRVHHVPPPVGPEGLEQVAASGIEARDVGQFVVVQKFIRDPHFSEHLLDGRRERFSPVSQFSYQFLSHSGLADPGGSGQTD